MTVFESDRAADHGLGLIQGGLVVLRQDAGLDDHERYLHLRGLKREQYRSDGIAKRRAVDRLAGGAAGDRDVSVLERQSGVDRLDFELASDIGQQRVQCGGIDVCLQGQVLLGEVQFPAPAHVDEDVALARDGHGGGHGRGHVNARPRLSRHDVPALAAGAELDGGGLLSGDVLLECRGGLLLAEPPQVDAHDTDAGMHVVVVEPRLDHENQDDGQDQRTHAYEDLRAGAHPCTRTVSLSATRILSISDGLLVQVQ